MQVLFVREAMEKTFPFEKEVSVSSDALEAVEWIAARSAGGVFPSFLHGSMRAPCVTREPVIRTQQLYESSPSLITCHCQSTPKAATPPPSPPPSPPAYVPRVSTDAIELNPAVRAQFPTG